MDRRTPLLSVATAFALRAAVLLLGLVLVTAPASAVRAAPKSKQTTVEIFVDARVGWVATGVVLTEGMEVTITATGGVNGNVNCGECPQQTGPNGNVPNDPFSFLAPPDFLAPGVPAHSLVGRVGDAAPIFVGSGPTTVSGVGELSLAFNDNVFHDNAGGYTATISYSCKPGKGKGDQNHCHSGPPGQS